MKAKTSHHHRNRRGVCVCVWMWVLTKVNLKFQYNCVQVCQVIGHLSMKLITITITKWHVSVCVEAMMMGKFQSKQN